MRDNQLHRSIVAPCRRAGPIRVLVVLLTLVLGAALAQSAKVTSQVKRLHFWESHHGVLVMIDGMQAFSGACPRTEYVFLPNTHGHYDEILALLIAARTSGTQVEIQAGRACVDGFPRIDHIWY